MILTSHLTVFRHIRLSDLDGISLSIWLIIINTTVAIFATKKARYIKDYNDSLLLPPQIPTLGALKTDFGRPLTNLIDKANNVMEVIPNNETQHFENLHLSEQLLKLFPEVENVGVNYLDQNNGQKINELPIADLTEILSEVDKGEVPKQLELFEGGQNQKFENKVKLIGLWTDLQKFLIFLQSSFCQEVLVENKLKIHIKSGNLLFNKLDTNGSIYGFFQQQENQSQANIKYHFTFTDSYEDYFEWLIHGFKGSEDQKFNILTNKNSKHLFY